MAAPGNPAVDGEEGYLLAGILTLFLQDVVTGHDGLIAHVAGEGMRQHIAVTFGDGLDDLVAAVDLVHAEHDGRSVGDIGRVFGRNARDEQDIVTAQLIFDPGERGGGALHGLDKDDGLRRRVSANCSTLPIVVSTLEEKLSG